MNYLDINYSVLDVINSPLKSFSDFVRFIINLIMVEFDDYDAVIICKIPKNKYEFKKKEKDS